MKSKTKLLSRIRYDRLLKVISVVLLLIFFACTKSLVLMSPPLPPMGDVEISRYPTMECPNLVTIGQEFALQVSLTEDLITEGVKVLAGKSSEDGRLSMSMPPQESWKIDVVLYAPDFSFIEGTNLSSFILPRKGDSEPAIFHLHANSIPEARKSAKIFASLWHDGGFLARIVREVTIEKVPAEKGITAQGKLDLKSRTTDLVSQNSMVSINDARVIPNLSVEILEFNDRMTISIHSNILGPIYDDFPKPEGLSNFLQSYYREFEQYENRNVTPMQSLSQPDSLRKDKILSLCRNFGRDLYDRYAPKIFKERFWSLVDKLGTNFQTIQIYSNNPIIPWELMKPFRDSDEHEFLGMEFMVGKWPTDRRMVYNELPPIMIDWKTLVLIAPRYQGGLYLANQEKEIEALKSFKNFAQVPGDYATIKNLFKLPPQGIIHFSGHGQVLPTRFGNYEYKIFLESDTLDVRVWKGFMPSHTIDQHPLIFFNACEVGQSHQIANFLEGWAPALLGSGASGYIGGLWPIGDRGAADFAINFYSNLEKGLQQGPVSIAEALRKTRCLFFENGDPTFLSYTYFGNANLQLQMGLSEKDVTTMLKDKKFFDSGWNNTATGFDNEFVLQNNGQIVYDRKSGLMWQRGGSENSMTYEAAKTWVEQLNFAGHDDWRLPTLEEAMSLMEPRRMNGDLYIDPKFDKTQRWIYTSDLVKGESWAWVVFFGLGECHYYDFFYYGPSYVRAVRSGQSN